MKYGFLVRVSVVIMFILLINMIPVGTNAQDLPLALIQLRAVTQQDSVDGKLPGRATGMPVVAIGTTVYLDGMATVGENITVTEYIWKITGPDFSMDASTQNTTFIPAKTGEYTATLVVKDSTGMVSSPATQTIIAGTYVGIQNCALCHAGTLPNLTDKVSLWQNTDHASVFTREIDMAGSHYAERCLPCHTVGYDLTAVNNGFDDAALSAGWVFPVTLEEGNWNNIKTDYPPVANMANIQCENCHGPGSQHMGNPKGIATSLDSNMCGYCHDAMSHHVKNVEWEISGHSHPTTYPTGPGHESCVECHAGTAFVQKNDSDYANETLSTVATPVGCAVCHDPHSNDNEHHIRVVKDITLMNGEVISAEKAGMGALCMNCHHSRRNVNEYVQKYASHYGPHYSPQADMLAGTGGYEYEGIKYTAFSPHFSTIEDTCVSCHMAEAQESAPQHKIGGHTFQMVASPETVAGVTEYVSNVNSCAECHGDLESINKRASGDYDGDGAIEGIHDEIHGLLDTLGTVLPPYGDPKVEITDQYKPEELKAAYNYKFVEEDQSGGIHNPRYAVQLLQSSYCNLVGKNIPGADMLVSIPTDISEWNRY